MDIDKFIDDVNNADWQKFDDAEYFRDRYDGIDSFAQAVPPPLIALALIDKESNDMLNMKMLKKQGMSRTDFISNATIESNVRFAIGNDHRGTYYPVIREALPFIIEVALYGNHVVARNCAINALIDLYGFEPEGSFDPEGDADELSKFVDKAIKDMVARHRENFSKFAVDDPRNKSLIEDLFRYVDKQDEV